MKNFFLILLIILLSKIVACNNEPQAVLEKRLSDKQEVRVVVEVDKVEKEKQKSQLIEVTTDEKIALESRYYLDKDHSVKPIKEGIDEKVVLFTIDDVPNKYSVEMAQLLKELDINAIFFVNGHFIQSPEGKQRLKTIYDLGFEIGNHTMTHPNLKTLSEEQQRKEIIHLNDLIEEIIGERPRFFRAPFGVNTDVSKEVVAQENMQWMNWTYGYDFEKKYMDKDALAEIMVYTPLLKSGANILMHDHLWTLEALPNIVQGLREQGYGFVNPKEIK